MRSPMVASPFTRAHLRARDLRKFGAPSSVSLTVTPQRLAVIAARTLLRLLAGRLVPDAGEVSCTPETRSLVEQEMNVPDRSTVASVRAEALRSPRGALAALEDAASALPRARMAPPSATTQRSSPPSGFPRGTPSGDSTCALDAFGAQFRPERTLACLSVGQRYRLRLGCALADPAGTVLLDEPCNHLDDRSLERLVQWLVEFPGIVVFVTHDRWLLDAVAMAIFDLDPTVAAGGMLFGGPFPAYREARAGTLREWRRRYAASLDAERALSERLDRRARRSSGPLAAWQRRGQARTREPSRQLGSTAPTPH